MSRQVVEQVQCDHCQRVMTRPLVHSGVKMGKKEQAQGIPDGWVAVIRRYTDESTEGPVSKKVDNIYCGPECAIVALTAVVK